MFAFYRSNKEFFYLCNEHNYWKLRGSSDKVVYEKISLSIVTLLTLMCTVTFRDLDTKKEIDSRYNTTDWLAQVVEHTATVQKVMGSKPWPGQNSRSVNN